MAGLATRIKNAVKSALVATDDLSKSVAYVRVTPGGYNPETNALTTVETTTPIEYCVTVNLSEAEVDYFPANRNTQKLLIAAVDLAFIPAVNDYVLIDTVKWEVKRVKRVPGDSLFIIFVQEP